MKILFFHRNAECLGIEYLSSALQKAGHKVDLIFDPGIGDVEYKFEILNFFDISNKMIEKAKSYNPDLIAFSCLTNLYPWVSKMASRIKQSMNVPIIVGGMHPTILPDFVIKNSNIDMICIGEGDEALVELAESMQNNKMDYSIRNIWFKNNGNIIRNLPRPLLQDLDSLSFPDKELFKKYGCFSVKFNIMTGRGCPYQCTYCFNSYYRSLFCGNYIRRRSVQNVIDELYLAKSKYSIGMVSFFDDIFTLNDEWVKDFCKIYKQKINLPFNILVHPQIIKEEIIELLGDAGCFYVEMGIESGNEALRRTILKRYMSNQDIERAIKILKKFNIKIATLNMIGFPNETREQMWETYELNRKLKPHGTVIAIPYPFPKTEFADYCLQNGFLEEEGHKEICEGRGGFKEGTLLKNVEIKEAQRLQVVMPILIKTPVFLHPLIKRLPINSLTRIISIFYISITKNAHIRIKESIIMFFKSHYLYLKRSRPYYYLEDYPKVPASASREASAAPRPSVSGIH